MQAPRLLSPGPGKDRVCADCRAQFGELGLTVRLVALALGVAAVVMVWQGLLVPFFLCAIVALYLSGPPACPQCRSRSTLSTKSAAGKELLAQAEPPPPKPPAEPPAAV